MRKKRICIIMLVAVIGALCGMGAVAMLLRPIRIDVEPIDLTRVKDGEYIGVHQNKILFAVVRVCVDEGNIVEANVLFHKDSYMAQAEQVAADIVARQSLEVDTISGATLTCDTVKKAAQNALLQGVME